MKKTRKIIISFLCLLFVMVLHGATADAANVKSSYTVKKNTLVKEQKAEVKGKSSKTVTLNVKETGKLKVLLSNNSLKKNEKIKVSLINSKGKTITSKTQSYKGSNYMVADVKKGTYKLKFTTSGIKKNVKKSVKVSFLLIEYRRVTVGGGGSYDISNSKGESKFKLTNPKDQIVTVGAWTSNYYYVSLSITDSKGHTAFTDGSSNDECDFWKYQYLPKGTYFVTVTTADSAPSIVSMNAFPREKYSKNLYTNATTKEKAATFDGAPLQLAYSDYKAKTKTHWIKIDTAKQDYALRLYDADWEEEGDIGFSKRDWTVYKQDGTKVNLDNLDFAKGTGIYYITIPSESGQVICLEQYDTRGVVLYNGKCDVIEDGTSFSETIKSDSNKKLSATVRVDEASYVWGRISTDGKEIMLHVVDNKGNALKGDVDGKYKLEAGITYTMKADVPKANIKYYTHIEFFRIKYLGERYFYTNNKTVTTTIKELDPNYIYQFQCRPEATGDEGKSKIEVYENGKKIDTVKNTNRYDYRPKANATYKFIVTSSEDRMLFLNNKGLTSFSAPKLKLSSTKEKATNYKIYNDKIVEHTLELTGKQSGWFKVTNKSNKKTYVSFKNYMTKGNVTVQFYDQKGKLKKTEKLYECKDYYDHEYAAYYVPAKEICYVKVTSTDANTKAYGVLKSGNQ